MYGHRTDSESHALDRPPYNAHPRYAGRLMTDPLPALAPPPPATADRDSRHAALSLGTTLPGDVVLYLLLPMFHETFGVSLAEAGVLLAANRLVRIGGYGWVVRFYGRHGDRATCLLAVLASVACAAGYALLSGFWALLPLRLLWGLAFAALNLVTQALSTALPQGAASRSGRSRAYIAAGPLIALPAGAALTQWVGPRAIFMVLALVAALGLLAVRRLPRGVEPTPAPSRRRLQLPGPLDVWSFLEGFTLDGLFIIGLSYLGRDLMPGHAVMAAGVLLALRYGAEIVLSPLGGRMADRFGAERLLVGMSLLTSAALLGFGAGALLSCATAIVVLRALQLPLIAPIVVRRYPGPGRVQALATRSVWRDIGAGTGPLVAGLALPVVPSVWLYGVAAALLALAAWACGREARTIGGST
jgi:predicted MFS family arabinose efflux permease